MTYTRRCLNGKFFTLKVEVERFQICSIEFNKFSSAIVYCNKQLFVVCVLLLFVLFLSFIFFFFVFCCNFITNNHRDTKGFREIRIIVNEVTILHGVHYSERSGDS